MNTPAILQPVITTTGTAYTSGDVVGGLLSFKPGSGKDGNGEIRSLALSDDTNQSAALTLLFFKSLPAGTYTDNGAFAWGTGDVNLFIGSIAILTTDYTTFNSKGVVCFPTQLGVQWKIPTDPTGTPNIPILYGVLVTTSTPTYGANSTTLTMTLELGNCH
jgi:hypothetical protein